MKAKIVVRCFGMLMTISFILLIAQPILATIFPFKPAPIHSILPITSFPHMNKSMLKYKTLFPDRSKLKEKENKHQRVIVYLHNGSEIHGNITYQDDAWVHLDMDGSQVGFQRSEISKIVPVETT